MLQMTARQNVPTGAIVAGLFMGVTKCSLDWIWDLFHGREFIPSIVNMVKTKQNKNHDYKSHRPWREPADAPGGKSLILTYLAPFRVL